MKNEGTGGPKCFHDGDVAKGFMATFALWLLSREKMHGYALIKKMQKDGLVKASGSRVYPLLFELEGCHLVRSVETMHGGHRLRIYSTTRKGIGALTHVRKTFFIGLKKEFFEFMLNR